MIQELICHSAACLRRLPACACTVACSLCARRYCTVVPTVPSVVCILPSTVHYNPTTTVGPPSLPPVIHAVPGVVWVWCQKEHSTTTSQTIQKTNTTTIEVDGSQSQFLVMTSKHAIAFYTILFTLFVHQMKIENVASLGSIFFFKFFEI